MPQCSSCPKKQSFLNPGNLCKDCYGAPTENATTPDDIELTKKVNDMTLGDIVNVIHRIITPISEKLDKLEHYLTTNVESQNAKLELLKASVKEKEQTIDTMSQIIINMQSSLNRIDSDKRITNIMVSGLSENNITDNGTELKNDAEKVERLFEVMNVDAATISSLDIATLEMSRIGQQNESVTRLLKIDVKSKATRDRILDKAKDLKGKNEPWKRVYVKKDVHIVYAKENQRLNNRRKDLREKNPSSDIKILDGKLLIDDRVVDRNMFFR
jgi:hypothetical protein